MLRAVLTDLWYPDGEGGHADAAGYGAIIEPTDLTVEIPLNGPRTVEITVPDNHVAAWLAGDPYWYALWVWWDDKLIFGGHPTPGSTNAEAHTATIKGAGPEIQMIHHFLRYGDQALNSSSHPTLPNEFNRKVPPNGEGARMIRDAANLSASQALDYPPLGIRDGFDDTPDYDPGDPELVKYGRGDEVFQTLMSLAGLQAGPDIEIAPVYGVPGVYAELNTYERQGTKDATNDVEFTELAADGTTPRLDFHSGWGHADCIANLEVGDAIVTHAHILADGAKERLTRANTAAAADYGVYVMWEETDIKAGSTAALKLRGDQLLDQYSNPGDLLAATLTLTAECRYEYLRDFMVGTRIRIRARDLKSATAPTVDGRITKVTLRQRSSGDVETALEVIPTLSLTGTEEEA